ncbi:MAG: hypothetical protein RMN51_10635 [Verrucomicrobiota bacterium]|nr:hypothetical protein [Limisphaera sp.]MDW8382543.1 hypothetical protein [Verrucomicrobiota bacterium]
MAGLVWEIVNRARRNLDLAFSWGARNFMAMGRSPSTIRSFPGGFALEGLTP